VPVAYVGRTPAALVGKGYNREITIGLDQGVGRPLPEKRSDSNQSSTEPLPPTSFATTQVPMDLDSDEEEDEEIMGGGPSVANGRDLGRETVGGSTGRAKPVVPALEMHLDTHPIVQKAVKMGVIPSRPPQVTLLRVSKAWKNCTNTLS